jgi:hypothetical protein
MRWAVHIVRIGPKRSAYRRRASLEDISIDGRIILKCIIRKQAGGCRPDYVARDSDRWRALVNWLMNLRIPYMTGFFFFAS